MLGVSDLSVSMLLLRAVAHSNLGLASWKMPLPRRVVRRVHLLVLLKALAVPALLKVPRSDDGEVAGTGACPAISASILLHQSRSGIPLPGNRSAPRVQVATGTR